MTQKLFSSDKFADNIEPAGFTLYTNNEIAFDIPDASRTENDVTRYICVKVNGNADDQVTESDWSALTAFTFNNTSQVPFDYGFGRPSQIGSFGGGEEHRQ